MDFKRYYLPGLSVDAVNNSANKKIVNHKYYPIWATDIHLMLSIYGLEGYIYEERLPKIKREDEEYSDECIRVFGAINQYYKKSVNKQMIKNDNKAKWIISNNLDDYNKIKIDFKTKTAYEIWNLIKNTYQKSDEERKIELKKQLEEMKYDRNGDFLMYLSNMNNIFNKLEELKATVSDELKFNYLYSSLPSDIAQGSNMIVYQEDWKTCCEYLAKTIPRLKFIKEMKNKQNRINALNTELRTKNQYKYNERKANITCYNCNRKGHLARECNVRNKSKNKRGNYNSNNRRDYNSNKNSGPYNNYKNHNNNNNRYNNHFNNNNNNNYRSKNKNESNNAEIQVSQDTNIDNYNSFYASALAKDYNEDLCEGEQQSNYAETKNF